MTLNPKDLSEKTTADDKVRLMPIPGKRRPLKKSLESINRRFAKTLSRLAK